jgi:hypothetical protein
MLQQQQRWRLEQRMQQQQQPQLPRMDLLCQVPNGLGLFVETLPNQ